MSAATAFVRRSSHWTRVVALRSHLPSFAVARTHPCTHSATHRRRFASAAARRPADTRVDINLTANRPPIDALFSAYLQSPSQQTLAPLLATLTIHHHLYQLSAHLRMKLSAGSATANLFFSPLSTATTSPVTSSSESSSNSTSTAAISFAAVNVQQLEDEVLSERIVKTFQIQPPPHTLQLTATATAATTSTNLPIVVESDWRTERNKIRGLGVHSYSMRVLVHVPLQLTAAFPASLASAASILLSDQYASFVLTDGHDSGVAMRDEELAGVLPVLMGMGGLTQAEWVWLMSVLCTYPSDVAFDALSAALEGVDRD